MFWVGGWKVSEWGHDFLLGPGIIIYLVIVTGASHWLLIVMWAMVSLWQESLRSVESVCLTPAPAPSHPPWPGIGACRGIMTPSLLSNNYTQKYSINSSIEIALNFSSWLRSSSCSDDTLTALFHSHGLTWRGRWQYQWRYLVLF